MPAVPSQAVPVHLVTGLLGSGKTTAIRYWMQHKPAHEQWGILVNEFGEVDIDAAILQSEPLRSDQPNLIQVREVSGGCVCCTAQIGLIQGLNELLEYPLDRIIIEPTGLGHPARIIDTLKQSGALRRPVALQSTLCLLTPKQLTAERWKKSAVMRDLVTLADRLYLNQCDLSSPREIESAQRLLAGLYPPRKAQTVQFGEIELNQLLRSPLRPTQPFLLIQGSSEHQQAADNRSSDLSSCLPEVKTVSATYFQQGDRLQSIGWVWTDCAQFQRPELKHFFETLSPYLLRAKGILKTGREWQLIQWGKDTGLHFSDIAWRRDSRLELIFTPPDSKDRPLGGGNQITVKAIEIQLLSCLYRR